MKSGKPTIPSFPPEKSVMTLKKSDTFKLDLVIFIFITPQLNQLGEDDEAGFLSNGVGEVHSPLDDCENNLLNVLCPYQPTNKPTKSYYFFFLHVFIFI